MRSKIVIPNGKNCESFIIDSLEKRGFKNPNLNENGALIGRAFNIGRVDITLKTGTDRDSLSQICTETQLRAIKNEGLGPGDIIYANRLGIVITYVLPSFKRSMALSVYDSSKLDHTIPSEKRVVGLDEMFKVINPYTFNDALIAVFCPEFDFL